MFDELVEQWSRQARKLLLIVDEIFGMDDRPNASYNLGTGSGSPSSHLNWQELHLKLLENA